MINASRPSSVKSSSTPSAWDSSTSSFGGDPHPEVGERSFTSATGDRVSSNTEIVDPSKNLKTAGLGAAPWGFSLVQDQEFKTFKPAGE